MSKPTLLLLIVWNRIKEYITLKNAILYSFVSFSVISFWTICYIPNSIVDEAYSRIPPFVIIVWKGIYFIMFMALILIKPKDQDE